jgi:regulator of protease activity HflC (stomatin/prohibitin superfamily)
MDMVVTGILGILALYLFGGLKVLREYERAVYFFLGRSWGAKGPPTGETLPAALKRNKAGT